MSIIISLCLSSYHCDLLWYVRCVAEEEQKNDANRDNTTLNKKVRELQVALQELGREYQTLQVSVLDRQTDRHMLLPPTAAPFQTE